MTPTAYAALRKRRSQIWAEFTLLAEEHERNARKLDSLANDYEAICAEVTLADAVREPVTMRIEDDSKGVRANN